MIPLTKSIAQTFPSTLLSCCADMPWAWSLPQLLADRPRKWELSLTDLGLFGFAIISEPAEGHHHLHLLAVHPRSRRTGIGSALIEAAQSRVRKLTLKVPFDNYSAQRFYLRRGFSFTEGGPPWFPMEWTS